MTPEEKHQKEAAGIYRPIIWDKQQGQWVEALPFDGGKYLHEPWEDYLARYKPALQSALEREL